MQELTEKQKKLYDWVMANRRLVPPTLREVGKEFGMTVKGVLDHMRAIEKKGFEMGRKRQKEVEKCGNAPIAASELPSPRTSLLVRRRE